MEIIYDKDSNAYIIIFGSVFELPLFLNTDDIVEAREIFIRHMTFLFNDAVREQLKYSL